MLEGISLENKLFGVLTYALTTDLVGNPGG
jgi:hypothetical protein